MSDGRTDAVTSAPSRVRGASERPRRGHGPMDALPVLARSHCVRLSLPLRLPLARWIVDSDPFLDAVFRMNRRAGEDAFRPLLASVLGVRPPQAPLSQPPRRDGAWPQHEVIIGAADGQNNSSILTCLKTDSFLLALKQTLDSVQSCKFGKFKIMSIDRQGIIYN